MTLALLIAILALPTGTTESAEARVRAAATELLAETYPELASSLAVRVERLTVDVLSGDVRVVLQKPGVPRAHAKVDVQHRTSGSWDDAGWAILYVAHYDSVAVPTRDVMRGEPVADEEVTGAWIETTRFRGQPVTMARYRALRASGGAVAEHNLSSGEALREGDLRRPWVVETGDAVTLEYERPGLRLELKTRAREHGAVDDEIRVHCSDTEAIYRARLTGPGRALWLETL